MVADKQDHYADLITELTGNKKLAEAVIEDYIIAQKKLAEGFVPEEIFGKEELKKAFLQQTSLAQSFVYDYNSDVLQQGNDPEFWEGGYAVPEPYDPQDPFNDYYPWAEDLNNDELDVDDWVRFGGGSNWDRNRSLKTFHCKDNSEDVTGYYRNDFTHTDYVFETDFKVDASTDDDAAGIVFRYIDDQNYYMFMVTGGDVDGSLGINRPMQLIRITNGSAAMMGSPMSPFTWVRGSWQHLKVSVIGDRIQVWVNGRMQYDFKD
jgi:hypothetical protein